MIKPTVKRDPIKLEWVVIELDNEHILPVHPYKSFSENVELADLIVQALLKKTNKIEEHK